MAELGEKQFELAGVVFGLGAPIEVKEDGWSPAAAAQRNGDVDRAGGGIRFGRDRRGSATWGFDLFTNAETEDAAWTALAELAAAWNDEELRDAADKVTTLRYRVADRTRRIYGRPHRWDATPNNLSLNGRIDVVADFGTVDDLVYEDDEQAEMIDIAPPSDPETGFIVPFIPPVTSTPRSAPRTTRIVVGGTAPTPVTLVIDGPVGEARVSAAGWTAVLLDYVASDDPVTIDARPWARSATKKSGGGVRLNPRLTSIAKMKLPPGEHDVSFTGVDATSSATVTLRWHNAHRSPR